MVRIELFVRLNLILKSSPGEISPFVNSGCSLTMLIDWISTLIGGKIVNVLLIENKEGFEESLILILHWFE